MTRLFRNLLLAAVLPLFAYAAEETLSIKSSDGFTLKGWLSLPEKGKKPYPLALMVHEFASDHGMWDEWAKRLRQKGFATFTVDLRAHGASTEKGAKRVVVTLKDFGQSVEGTAFEKIPEDLKAWMELLDNRKELDLEAPLFFGSSLGGGALVPLMIDYEPRAVVTLSPAAPKKSYAEDALESVESTDSPWLIVSSQKDFALAHTLEYGKKALRPTLLILPGSGHGSKLMPASEGYVWPFLEKYLK